MTEREEKREDERHREKEEGEKRRKKGIVRRNTGDKNTI